MEKLRFGLQVMLLMLALPFCFIVQMKHIDKAAQKSKAVQVEYTGTGSYSDAGKLKTGAADPSLMPTLKLVVND